MKRRLVMAAVALALPVAAVVSAPLRPTLPAFASASSGPFEKTISASVVYISGAYGSGCYGAAVLQFPDVRGAVSYKIDYLDNGRPVPVQGPPFFPDDPMRTGNERAPAGTHWLGLSGGTSSDPSRCSTDDSGLLQRFKVVRAVAIFNKKPKPTVSGRVLVHTCVSGRAGGPCRLKVEGADGRAVAVSGPKGRGETLTDANGYWELQVAKGRYTVRMPGAGKSVRPASRSVDVRGDVGGQDFFVCKAPPRVKRLGCELVEIRGTVRAADGSPYGVTEVTAPGDVTQSDSQGHFAGLFVPKGKVVVQATSVLGLGVTRKALDVSATRKVNTIRVTLPVTAQLAQISRTQLSVWLNGLPRAPVTFHIKRDSPLPDASCDFEQSQSVSTSPDRYDSFLIDPQVGGFMQASEFCAGHYTGTVLQGTRTLVTTKFVIP